MITYKKYLKDNLAEGAYLALKHRLFVPTWNLSGVLRRAAISRPSNDSFENTIIALAFDGNTPVAIALVTSWLQVMVFCRKAYRRQGIASSLVIHLGVDKDIVMAGEGIYGSVTFWKNNGIKKVSPRI